jgi:hypothetical protein
MTVVHDRRLAPASLYHKPECYRLTITPCEIVRLLASWCFVPLVITARGYQTTLALERVAEHWFGRDGFRASLNVASLISSSDLLQQ